MQINVAQLLKEPVGAKRNYKVDELAGENCDTHVSGNIDLTRTSRGIFATGKLTAQIKGLCSRCLCPAETTVKFKMDDEFFPVIDIISGSHLDVAEDEFTIDQNHILDLDEAIRQYIIMATPTKLLCKPDCPGICPVCGQEFAKGDCKHRNKPFDHRWDKLVQLEKESKV
ncbi:MAG: YceD family protein [Dehalococcoidia bacterium]|jgi:uncharacterized protein